LANSGSVSNDWLQLQYGWLPLLSDVNGACEELARKMTYQPEVGNVKATSKQQRDIKLDGVKVNPTWPAYSGSGSIEITCNGCIEYRIGSRTFATLANTGLINPLEVAWELIPYSFVVDWFLPVGGFLNNLDYDVGLEFTRGWYSFHGSGRVNLGPASGPNSDGVTTQEWSGGYISVESRGFRREALSGFPAVPTPGFKDPLSLRHVENALALLRQAVGR
jgi:hypothetical protein